MTLASERQTPTVLSVAFPYARIGHCAVGGAEVVCTQVEAALHSLSYGSVVVAHAQSTPLGQLYGTRVPDTTITEEIRREVERRHQANIDQACAENEVALVHMHGLDFHRYHLPEHLPVVVTLHLPPGWYPESIWSLPANYHLLCVSEHQRKQCPAHVQHRVSVVANGVALPERALLRDKGRYALMLARICPEKNLHVGFDAACVAGLPAMLGGEVFPYAEHQQYFREQIEPRLTTSTGQHEARCQSAVERPTARFLGPVSGQEKSRLLSRAACMLLPSLAPETSSIVAMEALAAGVPVIAMAVGAVPEIVEDGQTGFLIQPGNDATVQMAQAIRRVPEIDRANCRSIAEARFPLARMLQGYAGVYRKLLNLSLGSRNEGPMAASKMTAVVPSDPLVECMAVELLTQSDQLRAIAKEWACVWAADPYATPFQHPAWLLPWWRQFGPDGDLLAVAVRKSSSGNLLALLPTYLYANPSTNQRQLLLTGAGTTDYLDGIWHGSGEHAAGLAVSHLLKRSTQWDNISLHQLRSVSPLLKMRSRLGFSVSDAEPCATLDVRKPLPSKIRANLNRYRRKAEAQGSLICELCREPDQILPAFETLVDLHSRRWQNKGEAGVLSDQRVLRHHREALPLLAEAGLLRLFKLSLGDAILGVLYGLADAPHVSEPRLYLYLIGFDERFAEFSPGSLLLQEAWLYAKEHGFQKVDLLRGGEGYKQLWGAEYEPTYALDFAQHTAK